jgi:glycosyltransferase involved in cell wall biosynthesis
MKKLNIWFTSNSSPWTKFHGGGQIFLHNVAKGLSKIGHRVTVLYTGPNPHPQSESLNTDYKKEWASYIGYPFTAKMRQLNSITVYNKLRYIYKKHNFEVINSIGGEALFLPKFCKAAEIPFFVSIEHPNLSACSPKYKWHKPSQTFMNIIRARELWICKYACKRAIGVITPSNFSKLEAIKYFKLKSSKIRVVNHGIIDEMLVETSKSNGGDPKGPLLFFGRLEPQKGVDLLIRAYFRLIKEKVFVNKDLIIIGGGPFEKEYRKTAYNLGLKNRVVFKGWKSPSYIRDKLSEASCCVLPSTSESFGLSIAETLSQGVPLITTSAGSIPEVADFGRGAWLAKPNDQNSLYCAIREAIENYKESLRKAEYGKQFVRKKFTWEKAALEYEKIYFETLNYT